ncbi:MucR family transcriptional regulator [Novosphingobium terrae]|uniref:MucR family transcriptional regulator n=1 Tax=Novosphingobium terrae TaxID=2726189 RepID=UPI001980FFD3|nr:MucR family transcriptional regulator [Novosphingobium terrae]
MADTNNDDVAGLIELAGDITIAWLQNPNVKPEAQDVHAFLKDMHAAVTALSNGPEPEPEAVTYQPKVPARGSVKPDHIVSLIDGKKYKTLKRHLSLHGLTPDQYRERYGLKHDYPMVSADYATQRREIAQKLGLGRKSPAKTDAVPATEVSSKPKRAAAKSKVEVPGASVAVPAPGKKVAAPAKAKAPAVKVKTATAPKADAAAVTEAAAAPAKGKAAAKTVSKPKATTAKKAEGKVAKAPTSKPGKATTVKAPAPEAAPEATVES